jgi:hypothetical protein
MEELEEENHGLKYIYLEEIDHPHPASIKQKQRKLHS